VLQAVDTVDLFPGEVVVDKPPSVGSGNRAHFIATGATAGGMANVDVLGMVNLGCITGLDAPLSFGDMPSDIAAGFDTWRTETEPTGGTGDDALHVWNPYAAIAGVAGTYVRG
jgi:hypothetical protein